MPDVPLERQFTVTESVVNQMRDLLVEIEAPTVQFTGEYWQMRDRGREATKRGAEADEETVG